MEHRAGTLPNHTAEIGIDPEPAVWQDACRALLRHLPLPRLRGRASARWRVFGKLAYDEGATVGTLLSVRFTLAAALFWLLDRRAREAARARPPRPRHRASGSACAATRCRPAATSPRSTGSTPRCSALLVYTYPAMVAVAAVAARPRAARRAPRWRRSCWPRRAWCSSWPARRRRARPARRRARARRRASSTASTSWSARASPRACRPQVLAALVVHRRGGHADRRLGRARRAAPGRRSRPPAGAGWPCLAVVSTVGAISLFFAGLERVGPTTAAILSHRGAGRDRRAGVRSCSARCWRRSS